VKAGIQRVCQACSWRSSAESAIVAEAIPIIGGRMRCLYGVREWSCRKVYLRQAANTRIRTKPAENGVNPVPAGVNPRLMA
jgi:hypothetical protein